MVSYPASLARPCQSLPWLHCFLLLLLLLPFIAHFGTTKEASSRQERRVDVDVFLHVCSRLLPLLFFLILLLHLIILLLLHITLITIVILLLSIIINKTVNLSGTNKRHCCRGSSAHPHLSTRFCCAVYVEARSKLKLLQNHTLPFLSLRCENP